MSLKDNFNQALKEILRNDGQSEKNPPEPPPVNNTLENFLGNKDQSDISAPRESGAGQGNFSSAVPNYTDTAEFFRQSVNRAADPFKPLPGGNPSGSYRTPSVAPLGMSIADTAPLPDLPPLSFSGGEPQTDPQKLPSDMNDEMFSEPAAGIPESTGSADTVPPSSQNEAAAAAIADAASGIPQASSAPPPNSMAAAMNAAMNAAMGTAMGAPAASQNSYQGFSSRGTVPSSGGFGRGGGSARGSGGMYPPPPPSPPPIRPSSPFPSDPMFYESEETTVISRNIVVTGGTITGFANVHIDGSIKCDVRITKDVNVTGKVVGDIECNNAVMAGSSIQGSIASKGQVRMDRDSVLLGDISTQYLDINGRVKGNVEVGGKAEFKTDAVIVGDITASTITVLDGAVIKGYVNTTFLQDSDTNVFPDTITVSDQ